MDEPSGRPLVSRSKTSPFLVRTFAKIGGFHRLTLFEDGSLPTTDEHQIFTWRDATLREVLTTLRNTSPHVAEFKHPLARFSFRTIYADSTNKGRFASKDLGMVYSRDILGEPGSLNVTAPRLLETEDHPSMDSTDDTAAAPPPVTTTSSSDTTATPMVGKENAENSFAQRERQERTLEELRFVPGDYLCVSVILPKGATTATAVTTATPTSALSELNIKGANATAAVSGWKMGGGGDRDRDRDGRGAGAGGLSGRGGGHWRGGSDAPPSRGIGGRGPGGGGGGFGGGGGRGGFGDRDRGGDRGDRRGDRDRGDRDGGRDGGGDRDRRVPPPRRHDASPPPRSAGGWGARGGRGGGGGGRSGGGGRRGGDRWSRSPSRSRSRSRSPPPPPRRRARYD